MKASRIMNIVDRVTVCRVKIDHDKTALIKELSASKGRETRKSEQLRRQIDSDEKTLKRILDEEV